MPDSLVPVSDTSYIMVTHGELRLLAETSVRSLILLMDELGPADTTDSLIAEAVERSTASLLAGLGLTYAKEGK